MADLNRLTHYLALADRPNTRRSYRTAIAHYETSFRGLLPATADGIAGYLAAYAGTLSNATLQHRLAALSAWHREHGFEDPTKAPVVRQVLKGIRTAHNTPDKQARPLALSELEAAVAGIASAAPTATDPREQRADHLRRLRDTAMLLLGFWRGFRADELTRLAVEHIRLEPGVGLTCYLPYSKGDRANEGRAYPVPALSRLCPVCAVTDWLAAAGLTTGPLFPAIDRWGNVSGSPMASGSIVPWLRNVFSLAGMPDAATYSSHSLRRGFANWATHAGWDLKALMDYVGWKDMSSALRYLDPGMRDLQARFEPGLATPVARMPVAPAHPVRRIK